jgi:hypothetical protein
MGRVVLFLLRLVAVTMVAKSSARVRDSCSSSVQEAWLYGHLVSAHSEGREPDAEPDRPAGPETQGSVASRWLVIAVITSGMSGYGNV